MSGYLGRYIQSRKYWSLYADTINWPATKLIRYQLMESPTECANNMVSCRSRHVSRQVNIKYWVNTFVKNRMKNTSNEYDDKTIERHRAHTIFSWPNPKQWIIVHTSDLMMMIIQSISIITRGMGKLKTHSPIYCIMDNTHTRQNISDRHFICSVYSDKVAQWW